MSTYVPIQAITLTSNTTSIEFTGIPQNYSDLVIVCSIRNTGAGTQTYPWLRFNGDSGSNYSFTRIHGNESNQAVSGRASNQSRLDFCEAPGAGSTSGYFAPIILQIPNYSSTVTNKSTLVRFNNLGGAVQVGALVGLWRSTSAITSILVNGDTSLASGSTFTLYGIGTGTPRAFGGTTVRTDGTFWYHIFQESGLFIPLQNLTNVDYLVVAGGGAGGHEYSGGGGAGGFRTSAGTSGGNSAAEAKLSLTANTPYPVVVGAGGATPAPSALTNGLPGSSSSFGSIVAIGGGGGGGDTDPSGDFGGPGGSGGGGGLDGGGGPGTANQGFGGGLGLRFRGLSGLGGGGGGGAGVAGADANTGAAGNGGNGIASSITGTSVTYAGGGGGAYATFQAGTAGSGGAGGGGRGGDSTTSGIPVSGTQNTGGGGGARVNNTSGSVGAGSGGSGIVVIRYAV